MLVKKRKIEAEVDLTPMIDCVFQLIIFFMVALSLAVVYGIVIKFPLIPQNAQKQQKGKEERIIVVHIGQDWIKRYGTDRFHAHKTLQDGDLKLCGQPIQLWVTGDEKTRDDDRNKAWDYLEKQMAYLINAKGFKKDRMIIKGDVKTYQWKVVKVIDIAKKIGIESYSLTPPFR